MFITIKLFSHVEKSIVGYCGKFQEIDMTGGGETALQSFAAAVASQECVFLHFNSKFRGVFILRFLVQMEVLLQKLDFLTHKIKKSTRFLSLSRAKRDEGGER